MKKIISKGVERHLRWALAALMSVALLGADQPHAKEASQVHESSRPTSGDSKALAVSQPQSAVVASNSTKALFKRLKPLIVGMSPNQVVAFLAYRFLKTPYQAYSLDTGGLEQLRIDLTHFDCMLFVEQLLAIATAPSSWDDFVNVTRRLRYDKGEVSYCSRHHYFYHWAQSAESKGFLIDLTPKFTSHRRRKITLNYMSTHPGAYRPLRNPETFRCIRDRERNYQVIQSYVPNASLHQVSAQLKSGDLFAVATSVPGLDVTHMGTIVREGSSVSAIHAIPGRGVIRSVSFPRYVASVPQSIGAVILRPRPSVRHDQ